MVKPVLLDVNILLALGWQQHQFHEQANRWFDGLKSRPWVTCPLTECAFIRIAGNTKFRPGANLGESVQTLTQMRRLKGHRFWPADYSPLDEPLFRTLRGHQQVTDAYLLSLAVRREGVLATFDRGLKTLSADVLGDAARVELISSDIPSA